MSFERAFRASSYLLLFAGFSSLFANDAIGPLITILYVLALVASWKIGRITFEGWIQLVLVVVFVAFFSHRRIGPYGFCVGDRPPVASGQPGQGFHP